MVCIIYGKPVPRKEFHIKLATESVAVVYALEGTNAHLSPRDPSGIPGLPCSIFWSPALIFFSLISSKEAINIPPPKPKWFSVMRSRRHEGVEVLHDSFQNRTYV